MTYMREIDIEKFINIDYLTETRKERKKKTNEIFTPWVLIKRLMDKISEENWRDGEKTYLDPAAGNGNILCGILYRRIYEYGLPWEQVLRTTYATELMEDNVREMKERVILLLDELGIEYDRETAKEILENNIKCADFFKWNFEEWREYTTEELKEIEKNKKKK